MNGIIYLAENLINSKVYIGKTVRDLETRIKQHYKDGKTDNNYFHRALNKYGADNFQWTVIDNTNDEETLSRLEKLYIKIMQSHKPEYGYNLTLGGQGGIPNEETRKKMSEAKIGYKQNYEHITKISIANTGKKRTLETKKLISIANTGKKRNDEQKIINGIAHYKIVKCIETGETFISVLEASIKNNLKSSSGITDVCRGRAKTAGGYHWSYVV